MKSSDDLHGVYGRRAEEERIKKITFFLPERSLH